MQQKHFVQVFFFEYVYRLQATEIPTQTPSVESNINIVTYWQHLPCSSSETHDLYHIKGHNGTV